MDHPAHDTDPAAGSSNDPARSNEGGGDFSGYYSAFGGEDDANLAARASDDGEDAGGPRGVQTRVVTPVGDLDDLARLQDAEADGSRRRRRNAGPPGVSKLGLLSALAGLAACTLCYLPRLGADPVRVGLAAAGIGALGLLLSRVGRRVGAGVPFVGILLGLAAVGAARYAGSSKEPGTVAGWVKQRIDQYAPLLQPTVRSVAAPTAPPAARLGPPVPVAPRPSVIGEGTMFDERGVVGRPAARPTGAAPVATPDPAGGSIPRAPDDSSVPPPTPVIPPVAPRSTPEYRAALAAREAVMGKVKAAQDDYRSRAGNDPAYQAAKRDADAAAAEVERLKQTYDSYAPQLVQAATRRLEAQERLAKLASGGMDADAAVVAARRELAEADARLRAAENPAQPGKP